MSTALETGLSARGAGRRLISRGEALSWATGFLVVAYVAGCVAPADGVASARTDSGLAGLDLLAGAVAIHRLRGTVAEAAGGTELGLLAVLAAVGALGPHMAAPFALTLLGLWMLRRGDPAVRAAAAIALALAAHELWSRLVFAVLSPELVQVDAALVGSAVKATIAGATWRGNLISTGHGHVIAIADACSSFANVSSALLVWVAVTKLERLEWRRRDLLVGAAAVAGQVLLNAGRIYLMALSWPLFLYWHDGPGAQIYVVAASVSSVLIAAAGARWAARA